MNAKELLEILECGEDSRHQFKADVRNPESLAAELTAFSNSGGGRIFIGVDDACNVVGLAPADIARLNQLVANAASQGMRPSVNVATENVRHERGVVMVVTVPDSMAKPHMDKDGVYWVKNGANKSRNSREELLRIFRSAQMMHSDEAPVAGTSADDVDMLYFESMLEKFYGGRIFHPGSPDASNKKELARLLANMNLMRDGVLNCAGMLLFGRRPEAWLPTFIVKAVVFDGDTVTGERYLDSRDIGGKLEQIFEGTVAFLFNHTRCPQNGQSVNSLGIPEVPRIVWEELVVNALVHRDYFVSAPIRVFVFDNRFEIISPGHLPNNLTVDNIKSGNSNIRNPILVSFASKILPYRGIGSGILRVMEACPETVFVDDRENNFFKAVVPRKHTADTVMAGKK